MTASIEVVAVTEKPLHTARCRTLVLKEDGSIATEGEAMVMLPQPKPQAPEPATAAPLR